MKRTRVLALLAAALLLLTGCAAAPKAASASVLADTVAQAESYSYSSNATLGESASAPRAEPEPAPAGEPAKDAAYEKKIVYNAYLTIRADDPAAALLAAEKHLAAEDGYVAGSYTTSYDDGTRYASATLKVPADRLDTLLTALRALGEEENCRVESDDISLDYYDIYARLSAARAEEAQLLSILADCRSVEEILLVREQLSSVRESIESYQARINLWDHQVAYATVELTIRETEKAPVAGEGAVIELWQAADVWKRIGTGFQNSWRFLLNALSAIGIGVAYGLLPVAVLGALVYGLVRLLRYLGRKTRARRDARAAKRAAKKVEKVAKKAARCAGKAEKAAEKLPGEPEQRP